MTVSPAASIIALTDAEPSIDASAFVADGARIIGAVTLAPQSSVWYNAVLRADGASIRIGRGSNLQDNVSVHVDHGRPVLVGDEVSIGHNAVVHGCTIGDGSLVGMGATIMSGARIGAASLVAAGAVVLQDVEFPDGSLIAGVPAKLRRALTLEERAGLRANAESYLGHAARHERADRLS